MSGSVGSFKATYDELPEGWTTQRLKFVASVQNSNVDKVVSEDEIGVKLCNYTDVYYNDEIALDMPFMEGSATAKEIEKFTLKAGQVIITKDSESWDDIAIPSYVPVDMPGVVCGYHLSVFEADKVAMNGAFLAWLCRAPALNDQFKICANGVTRFGLGQYSMKNALVPLPPIETQKKIAAFLDEKTAQIDGLIEKKRALLEGLAEKRQALITQAVTKGLNPSAPAKDSGIDWLGPVPEHWEMRRLKEVCDDIVDCKNRTPPLVEDGEFFVIRTSCLGNGSFDPSGGYYTDLEAFKEWTKKGVPQSGDVLISREAPIGEACLFPEGYSLCLGQRMMLARPDSSKLNSSYLLFAIYSGVGREYVDLRKKGTTVGHLRVPEVFNFPILLPPVPEQEEIVEFLGAYFDKVSKTEIKVANSIDTLIEYRAALISSAVTGKLDGLQ